MEIQFSEPKDIVIIQERTKTIEKITVLELSDFPGRKQVMAKTLELGLITLWKDAEYDAIGQWTDTDVQNRIVELYGA